MGVFEFSILFHCSICLTFANTTLPSYGSFVVSLKIIVCMDNMSPGTLFFCRIVLATLVPLSFHENFRITLWIAEVVWGCDELIVKPRELTF